MGWLFLLAYACSGLAGLIYEVSWTRLLTLYIGHTTAAASAVTGAFLGGLAVGSSLGGIFATRLSPRRSLQAYVVLELTVAIVALLLPFELRALTPVLKWAYRNGEPGLLFPLVRLATCFEMVFVPAVALGATFPLAIRWYANDAREPARASGALYAVNTTGATIGALLAGFILIPAVGVSGTTRIGMIASLLAATAVAVIVLIDRRREHDQPATVREVAPKRQTAGKRTKAVDDARRSRELAPIWLPAVVLGVSGFASLMHEIVWTRILALLLGPTVYAFSAALAVVVAGIALGSFAAAWIAGRSRSPGAWLAFVLAAAAIAVSWTSSLAGHQVPQLVAFQMANSSTAFADLLRQGTLLAAALMLPTAFFLGAAFPLAFATIDDGSTQAAGRFSTVYAINTVGAVAGSLLAGFAFIPRVGLQATLGVSSVSLIAATAMVLAWGRLSMRSQLVGTVTAVAAAVVMIVSAPWDRALLASGPYLYAPYVPKNLDLETQLKAGALLYYREGAASTVSVKRLTGTLTLAVDGKVDASNRSDMLTQKLVAHLPLLLHENPREVGIVGLGSGVTLGAALSHPIARADVIEISPEVVEASRYFSDANGHALDDPRGHLIVGDGRSHLLLTDRQYDVIISEPSNPWIAGVAALFTREFFLAARDRLAPGGLICQWAHTYNISDADLRSIVATFSSVFPDGTLWLVGEDDVLLVASKDSGTGSATSPIARLGNIARNWKAGHVAADLEKVGAVEPFSVISLFGGGPAELATYSAGAALLDDDRMALEFSGPRQLHDASAGTNGAALASLLSQHEAPEAIERARAAAGAGEWRNRGAMMARSDVYDVAYDDYVRALTANANDPAALEGLVKAALLSGRARDALGWVRGVTEGRPPSAAAQVAISKLLAAINLPQEALDTAIRASALPSDRPLALEQMASLYADAGDAAGLESTVARLQTVAPDRAPTLYYAAALAFVQGRAADTVRLSERAIAADSTYAPTYDLVGAAYTRLGQGERARQAFESSLRFDAHDSTAYTNLGLLELAGGNRRIAANYFAEALSLAPGSTVARDGLAHAR